MIRKIFLAIVSIILLSSVFVIAKEVAIPLDINIHVSSAEAFSVNSPKEIVYFSKKINFNVSSDKVLKIIEYINLNDDNPKWKTLCTDCSEYGLYRNRKLTMIEGENNIIIRAMDENRSYSEKNITLRVESVKPIVFSTYPRLNKVVNGSEFLISYTEENLKSITLVYGNDIIIRNLSKECASGKKKECRFLLNLSDYENEPIYYYFITEDFVRSEKSQMTRLWVDTISPKLTIKFPAENGNYLKNVPFNVLISEKSRLEYLDILDNNPTWRALCSNCDEYGYEKSKSKIFKKGSHEILIRALDKAGNSDMKSVSFNVE